MEKIIERIGELVNKHHELSDSQKRSFNEQQTIDYFIRPLFEALGWDFTNPAEVVPQQTISGQRADYGFSLSGIPKFYLEAKALRVDINLEQHARQAINYAWNKGVTYAVLTNFENIKVFNAQAKSKDLLSKLIFEISCADYIADFERLRLLSRSSFLENALDQYAEKHAKKTKKQTVDEKLFDDLKVAREVLTKSFILWNERLKADQETLEEGVQKILDRLVFIRVLEDRGLEPPTLRPLLREWEASGKKVQLFSLLIEKFRELDEIYNSNIFTPHACEEWEEYDDSLKKVINSLYGDSLYEYNFKNIPLDILGGVYESYLSYIAQTPEAKMTKEEISEERAATKEKSRRKRKEQGIYYTPRFIVDYIVKNTLGKKLAECRTIGDLKKIRVLDPACGSGSFLTRALEEINDKYKEFGNKGEQYTKAEILLTNIYGVDLDSQAVEIAKLNLLIDTLDTRAKLPNLTEHIRVGNSLVSGEEADLKKYFGENWREKKPFSWQTEFEDVFKAGGFDVIIGNPPWGANIDEETRYLEDKYPNSTKAYKDVFKIFIDKAISLLKPNGSLGFIVPNILLYQPRYQDVKEIIDQYENFAINLGEKIFKGVDLGACILVLVKKPGTNIGVHDLTREPRELLSIKIQSVGLAEGNVLTRHKDAVIKKTEVTFDDVFLIKDAGVKHQRTGTGKAGRGKSDLREKIYYTGRILNPVDHPLYTGSDINRYSIVSQQSFFLRGEYKQLLKDDEIVYFDPRMMNAKEKIVWRQTADRIRAMIIDGEWFANTLQVAILKDDFAKRISLEYALTVFNSKYIDYLYHQKTTGTRKVFPQVRLRYLRDFPFVIGSAEQQKSLSDKAQRMIELHKELASVLENSDKWLALKEEIKRTDKKIDEEVYKLYGLSDEEKKIVEGSTQ